MDFVEVILLYFQKNLEAYISTCYDSIAIFLCLHLVVRYKLMCHKRSVPALDLYWSNVEMILKSRFEDVLHLNINSIRDYELFNLELGPHFVSVKD